MNIRPATLTDAPALAELGAVTFAETFGHLYSPENLAAHLARAHSEAEHARVLQDEGMGVWLALDDAGRAVAFAVAGRCKLPVPDLEPNAGELKQIYVRASHQNLYLGSQLMRAALAWLEARYSPLYIGVWSQNTGAQKLYGRYGFEKAGEYRFCVGDHYDHEFILKRPASWRAPAGS